MNIRKKCFPQVKEAPRAVLELMQSGDIQDPFIVFICFCVYVYQHVCVCVNHVYAWYPQRLGWCQSLWNWLCCEPPCTHEMLNPDYQQEQQVIFESSWVNPTSYYSLWNSSLTSIFKHSCIRIWQVRTLGVPFLSFLPPSIWFYLPPLSSYSLPASLLLSVSQILEQWLLRWKIIYMYNSRREKKKRSKH